MSLQMAIADFYIAHESGVVKVLVKGNEYYIIGEDHIGSGFAYDKEEIEYAAIATSIFDIEYIYQDS